MGRVVTVVIPTDTTNETLQQGGASFASGLAVFQRLGCHRTVSTPPLGSCRCDSLRQSFTEVDVWSRSELVGLKYQQSRIVITLQCGSYNGLTFSFLNNWKTLTVLMQSCCHPVENLRGLLLTAPSLAVSGLSCCQRQLQPSRQGKTSINFFFSNVFSCSVVEVHLLVRAFCFYVCRPVDSLQ